MNTNQNTIGFGFWLKWVFASCLGFAIGGVLSGILSSVWAMDLQRLLLWEPSSKPQVE